MFCQLKTFPKHILLQLLFPTIFKLYTVVTCNTPHIWRIIDLTQPTQCCLSNICSVNSLSFSQLNNCQETFVGEAFITVTACTFKGFHQGCNHTLSIAPYLYLQIGAIYLLHLLRQLLTTFSILHLRICFL